MTEKERKHQYYLKHREYFIRKAQEWKQKNPEKARESARKGTEKYRKGLPRLYKKDLELKYKYKISWAEYVELHNTQHGACAICKIPLVLLREQRGGGTANVDHCHVAKKVRGLLCNSCNQGLGYFKDNTTLLRGAAEYLDDSKGN